MKVCLFVIAKLEQAASHSKAILLKSCKTAIKLFLRYIENNIAERHFLFCQIYTAGCMASHVSTGLSECIIQPRMKALVGCVAINITRYSDYPIPLSTHRESIGDS